MGAEPVHRPRRQSRRDLLGIAAAVAASTFLLSVVGCGDSHAALSWKVVFAEDELRDRSVAIQGEVVEGGCLERRVRITMAMTEGTEYPVPSQLGDGVFGLRARARDANCRWYAWGCVEVDVPANAPRVVEVPLRAAQPEPLCPPEQCNAGTCDGMMMGCVPEAEICDGEDNDCDGMRDEDFDLASDDQNCGSCGRACRSGESCASGTCPSDVVEVALGSGHSCARRGNGEANCWGANSDGQVGDGTTVPRSEPQPAVGLVDALMLDLGRDHSCGLRAGGQLVCWGDNCGGRLGDGTLGSRAGAVTVLGAGPARHLAAGDWSSCGVMLDGSAVCWGRDALERCSTGMGRLPLGGAVVPGLADVEEVAVGNAHHCARIGGRVACWGDDANGQLGNGADPDGDGIFELPDITDAVAITASGSYSCALRASGTVSCWGENSRGQLGDGTFAGPRRAPVTVLGLDDVAEVDAGPNHACARRRSGEAFCWGANDNGMLGDGTTEDRAQPVPVVGLVGVTSIAAGGGHSCAATNRGEAHCWGNNTAGQLGDGTTASKATPARVIGLP